MSVRVTLDQLGQDALEFLDDEWRSPTEFQRWLGLGGSDFYRVALILERLANDGHAELKSPGARVRRFRRRLERT